MSGSVPLLTMSRRSKHRITLFSIKSLCSLLRNLIDLQIITLVWINDLVSMELIDKARRSFHKFVMKAVKTAAFDVSAQHSYGETAEVLTE